MPYRAIVRRRLARGAKHRLKSCVGLVALSAALMAFRAPVSDLIQEMEVPVSIQVPLFLKVMTFDRQRNQQMDVELVVGIAFQSAFRASVGARDDAIRALGAISDRKIRIVLIDVDRADLNDVLQEQHVSILYVAPLRAYDVATLAASASTLRVMTVTGVPHYVELGLAVGARLQNDRPQLLVNLAAARLCGADFTSELLKLVRLVP